MVKVVVGFVLGLVVGWNFLPQPELVKEWVEKVKNLLKSK